MIILKGWLNCLITNKKYRVFYGKKADMYSVGIIFFEMVYENFTTSYVQHKQKLIADLHKVYIVLFLFYRFIL